MTKPTRARTTRNMLMLSALSASAMLTGTALAEQPATAERASEQAAKYPVTRQEAVERALARFDKVDLNLDGHLTEDEVRQARTRHADEMRQRKEEQRAQAQERREQWQERKEARGERKNERREARRHRSQAVAERDL